MLAEKLKMSCMAIGTMLPVYPLISKAATPLDATTNTEQRQVVLLDMMQLEGMTARRIAALYAARIWSLSDLAAAPLYTVFKVKPERELEHRAFVAKHVYNLKTV